MSADRQIASFIAAVERNDLKAARWIYAGLDPQAQRQADLILVGKIAHHEDQAGLALERGEFMGRLATLMEIHSAETVADLPAHVLDQVNADLIALGLAEEELWAPAARRRRAASGSSAPSSSPRLRVAATSDRARWIARAGPSKVAEQAIPGRIDFLASEMGELAPSQTFYTSVSEANADVQFRRLHPRFGSPSFLQTAYRFTETHFLR